MKSLNRSLVPFQLETKMTESIETASTTHLSRLCQIENDCFKEEAFTRQQIARLLSDYNSIGLVAKEDGLIVGFIIAAVYADRGKLTGHILTLDILAAHRRKGIGTKLLAEAEKILLEKGARTCRLEVREDNVAALSLYQRMSYKRVRRLRNYYGKANGSYLEKTLT